MIRLYNPPFDGEGHHPHLRLANAEHTEPVLFSTDESCDIGFEAGSSVPADYGPSDNEFSSEVNRVQIDLGEDAKDADHYIDPEERPRD